MPHRLRLALYQPDIAPNVGSVIRTAACLDLALDIIEPCGFPFSLRAVRRQVMDYGDKADITRHDSWQAFEAARQGRLIALTTKSDRVLWDFVFRPGDVLLLGQESSGLPDHVHAVADSRLSVPMAPGTRSLNIGVAAAISGAEALRQMRLGWRSAEERLYPR